MIDHFSKSGRPTSWMRSASVTNPVKPMTAIYIKPGCRHRAIGKLKIINIPIPAFDERDEWFD